MNIGKIIGIVALALVVTTTGLLATETYNPTWNPFRPSPEKVLGKVGKNLEDIETFNSKIDGSLKGGQQEINFAIDYSYDSKASKETKMKGTGQIDFLAEGITMSGETDFITVKKELFLKVKTFPAVLSPYLQMFGLDSNSIKNQWIKVSTAAGEKAEGDQTIEDFEKKIQNYFDQLFVIKKEFNDEKVNGKDCYHYLVSLDSQKAKNITLDIMEEVNPNATPDVNELEKTFAQMKEIEGEVWVGKKDYNIYKLKTDSKVPSDQSNTVTDLNLEITFSDYNKELSINVPQDYTTLKELMQQGTNSLQQQLEGLQENQSSEEMQIPSQQYQY